jgi:hypothetical protein
MRGAGNKASNLFNTKAGGLSLMAIYFLTSASSHMEMPSTKAGMGEKKSWAPNKAALPDRR